MRARPRDLLVVAALALPSIAACESSETDAKRWWGGSRAHSLVKDDVLRQQQMDHMESPVYPGDAFAGDDEFQSSRRKK